MRNFCVFLGFVSLLLLNQAQSQTVVTVTTATYFNNPVGGGPNHSNGLNYNGCIFCRDQAEYQQFAGPNQAACSTYGFTTPPIDQGRWGQSAYGVSTQMSGLGFQGVKGVQVSPDTDFFLGQLTHFNWPIYQGTTASAINMNIYFSFTVAGSSTVHTQLFTFIMNVDETLNQAPCPYPGTTPCSDKISFNNSFSFSTTFSIDNSGVLYTLILEGFKESNVSSSSAITYFISNENENSQAYLFARIIEACPATCVNGGSYIVDANNDCSCDCSDVTCPGTKVTAPNCTCQCPPTDSCQNGGKIDPNTCNCICSNTCPSPQVRDNSDCSCNCPSNYCHSSGTISDPNTCACNCPTTACAITNQVRNATCDCVCNLSCQSPKVRSTQAGVCGCVCSKTCGAGYTIDQNTCNCLCTKTCINSVLNNSTCTCGPCQGNWVVDPSTGQCTSCPTNVAGQCAAQNEKFDADSCSCVCENLNCDLYNNGTVVDHSLPCGCKPCSAGQCICGNGRVEAGEQCDTANDPCCVNCQYTTAPCDDGNACTDNSFCNGTGYCAEGEYKCSAPTECANITCDPHVGTCVVTPFANGTACGPLPHDLCNYRCMSGTCQKAPVVCGADNNTQDCYYPSCNSGTGQCDYLQSNDSTSCSDGNPCTTNDACSKGTCAGQVLLCPAPDQCHNATCQYGTCVPYALENHPCNADNNACTVGDVCSGGVCLAGRAKVCNVTGQCTGASCNASTGICSSYVIPDSLNKTCDDNNICTYHDMCHNGTCKGIADPSLKNATQCGFIPIAEGATGVKTTSIAIFAAIGAAALIGAIIGLAILLKRIRQNKLLNPDTWNPDMFTSLGANPLYKGSSKSVDNALYEASK